ncbi:MAG: gcvH [Gemmatimonadetes bacterium]|nr:gcvH [Gemmatimonadota bacterium]
MHGERGGHGLTLWTAGRILTLGSEPAASNACEESMANVPQDLRYTRQHEYVRVTDDPSVVVVGITDYAQGELGDVVFVELPQPGTAFDEGASFGTIEAVKAVSDLYAPLAGEVVEANGALDANPAAVNADPYGEGWMIKMRLAEPSSVNGLMDAAAYEALIG